MLRRIISYFKNPVWLDNAFGWYCPDCKRVEERPSAFMHRLWDEQYKVHKKYIRCGDCGRTTPAFSDKKKAVDNWEQQWALVEDQILLGKEEEC